MSKSAFYLGIAGNIPNVKELNNIIKKERKIEKHANKNKLVKLKLLLYLYFMFCYENVKVDKAIVAKVIIHLRRVIVCYILLNQNLVYVGWHI